MLLVILGKVAGITATLFLAVVVVADEVVKDRLCNAQRNEHSRKLATELPLGSESAFGFNSPVFDKSLSRTSRTLHRGVCEHIESVKPRHCCSLAVEVNSRLTSELDRLLNRDASFSQRGEDAESRGVLNNLIRRLDHIKRSTPDCLRAFGVGHSGEALRLADELRVGVFDFIDFASEAHRCNTALNESAALDELLYAPFKLPIADIRHEVLELTGFRFDCGLRKCKAVLQSIATDERLLRFEMVCERVTDCECRGVLRAHLRHEPRHAGDPLQAVAPLADIVSAHRLREIDATTLGSGVDTDRLENAVLLKEHDVVVVSRKLGRTVGDDTFTVGKLESPSGSARLFPPLDDLADRLTLGFCVADEISERLVDDVALGSIHALLRLHEGERNRRRCLGLAALRHCKLIGTESCRRHVEGVERRVLRVRAERDIMLPLISKKVILLLRDTPGVEAELQVRLVHVPHNLRRSVERRTLASYGGRGIR